MSVLPVRSTSDTPADHVDDHNTLHELYNELAGGAGATDSPDATGSAAIALGINDSPVEDGARASGDYSVAIGGGNITDPAASATANDALAFGRSSEALHARSVALGFNATTTAVDQIVLGGTPHTVLIPGTLNIEGNVVTGAWTTWSPTLTNLTLGSGVVVAKYSRIGRTVNWRFKFVFGAGSAVGTSPQWTLPFLAQAEYDLDHIMGSGSLEDAGAATYGASVYMQNEAAGRVVIKRIGGSGSADVAVTSAAPFTWATGDTISAIGTYETAS